MKEINKILNKFDWNFIQSIYNKNNLTWDTFDNEEGERIPKENEIKEELKNIIQFMITNNTNYMMFDIFLVVYTNDISPNGDLIISIIQDTIHVQNINKIEQIEDMRSINDTISELEEQKNHFIETEDYENANIIHNEIKKLKDNE